MEQYAEVVLDLAGNAVPNASVQVLVGSVNGTLATIYDASGTPQQNPIITGKRGEFAFQAVNGKYVLRVLINGAPQAVVGPITLYDPTDVNQGTGAKSIESTIPAGATDHTPYFIAALAQGGAWTIGPGPFNFIGAGPAIAAGTKLFFSGTKIFHNTTTAYTFGAVNVDDWGIFGDLTITGAGKADGQAIGIYRQGCNRFTVENVRCQNISGRGFYEILGTHVTPRGDQGKWLNCSADNCWVGREDEADPSTEYTHWLNYNASGCRYPLITAAGNNRFLGGNVVDNDAGVWVKSGPNQAHGGFVGMNINHNRDWNIRLTDVVNGETFSGCHCFGDSPLLGRIWLERSKGFLFTGGVIDASVLCEDAIGYSHIANNYCTDSGNADAHIGNSAKKVIYTRNAAPTGMWKLNDPGTCYVRGFVGADQALTNGTPAAVKFTTLAYDNRDSYDKTTGIFTMPWLGNFRVSGSIQLEGSTVNPNSSTENSYLSIVVNGVPYAFAPIQKYSAAGGVGNFSVDVGGGLGTTVEVRIVAFGTDLRVTASTSRLSISEVS